MVNFESLNTLFPCIMDDLLFHFSYKQGEEKPGAATVAGLLSGLMKKYSLKILITPTTLTSFPCVTPYVNWEFLIAYLGTTVWA